MTWNFRFWTQCYIGVRQFFSGIILNHNTSSYGSMSCLDFCFFQLKIGYEKIWTKKIIPLVLWGLGKRAERQNQKLYEYSKFSHRLSDKQKHLLWPVPRYLFDNSNLKKMRIKLWKNWINPKAVGMDSGVKLRLSNFTANKFQNVTNVKLRSQSLFFNS